MKLKGKLLIGGCVVAIASLAAIGLSARRYQTQLKSQETRQLLFLYAIASTNYAATYGFWPNSLNDFCDNKSNILFVMPTTSKIDGWGRAIEYQPFDQINGFGLVRSRSAGSKQEVRFGESGILEVSQN